ncbi:methyl-accepting chemotaxis sensory transducer [Gloeothece citriformis PCC 7424]|uniref:Methyl-accepting chemotaxis sensory transducer n=1 Tax=Gloeothece citriformis (strain PCC 7424) TaxID=65393 RepID=B7KA48_GLOC7|nr:methyl-accepting chemotaxis protein [Gloeothece citriformis]ACK71404.1 methyl-accepting chemotaxis sensory transducer [Gloeothece citriformis PCC 7424]
MTSGIDYVKQYGKANAAYCRGDLDEAVSIINELAQNYPDDPNVLLLRGHIFVSLQQYHLAQQQYQMVLEIAQQAELIDYANKGLQQISIVQPELDEEEMEFSIDQTEAIAVSPNFHEEDFSQMPSKSDFDEIDWDDAVFSEEEMDEPTMGSGQSDPFINPFVQEEENSSQTQDPYYDPTFKLSSSPSSREESPEVSNFSWQNYHHTDEQDTDYLPFANEETEVYNPNGQISNIDEFSEMGDSTLVVSSNLSGNSLKGPSEKLPKNVYSSQHFLRNDPEDYQDFQKESSPIQKPVNSDEFLEDLEVFNDDDLDGLSQFDITDVAQSLPDSGLFDRQPEELDMGIESSSLSAAAVENSSFSKLNWTEASGENTTTNLSTATGRFIKPTVEIEQGKLAGFKNLPLSKKQWITAASAGVASIVSIFLVSSAMWIFSPKQPTQKVDSTATKTETASSNQKQSPPPSPQPKPDAKKPPSPSSQALPVATISPFSKSILWMMLCTGGASFGATFFLSRLNTNQIKQSVNDLQTQFDTIYAGDFNVKASIYSEDELGQLSARFNQMAQAILTTTSEAQRRAAETEQQQEDLQRQVIRLLDDVEGAARGDLTVEAEVTADVLGAVADAFNLTIHSLREIVRQVKKAAEQVNKSSTDSESFARNQSSDALRMAEELAVTLNSVQMMTDSIQRVAENAREAEEVARTSSVTALRGGESVERTVAGILQIRETVSETARKVKRLAEASQEINKIVAVVSQIASRTNLLALNASIQAARAGEAGRGFAIVADEVRQLADRSAKSLKEIEQIVLQIQSETGSVMTAMEEGIQQVIDVTERSEQAKRSLEDIIQVSNRIDTLVRSITADTVKQRENSREVAQVMQSVELTAQETSQESQRVAGSLQKLVKISQDLLESVERFKVDQHELK